jgi:hypothetical protein
MKHGVILTFLDLWDLFCRFLTLLSKKYSAIFCLLFCSGATTISTEFYKSINIHENSTNKIAQQTKMKMIQRIREPHNANLDKGSGWVDTTTRLTFHQSWKCKIKVFPQSGKQKSSFRVGGAFHQSWKCKIKSLPSEWEAKVLLQSRRRLPSELEV